MSKMSIERKIKKGILPTPVIPRELTQAELEEFQELHKLARLEAFKAAQVKANTALIPDGQKVAEQYLAISRLMENVKNQWFSQKLVELGYAQDQMVNMDIKTGKITLSSNVKS